MLRDDPLLEQGHVTMAPTAKEMATISGHLERLGRTRRWQELRAVIENCYQQTFGQAVPTN